MDEMLSGGFGPDLQKCAQESLKELLGENGFDYEKTVDPENPALLKKSGVFVKENGEEISVIKPILKEIQKQNDNETKELSHD